MKIYALAFFIFLAFANLNLKGQSFRSYDFLKENLSTNNKLTVVYFCATWCSPCMAKFIPIVDALVSDTSYNFLVVLDVTNVRTIVPVIEDHMYDKKYFKYMDLKYYAPSKGIVQFNPQQKAFKRLAKEFDERFKVTNSNKNLWVGSIAIYNSDKVFLTGADHNASELIELTKLKLQSFPQPE